MGAWDFLSPTPPLPVTGRSAPDPEKRLRRVLRSPRWGAGAKPRPSRAAAREGVAQGRSPVEEGWGRDRGSIPPRRLQRGA
ncbi:hypothetical protein GCM10020221_05360 [Streptomyces thioluteus]|uniref:Uncharacterized protein n=1 Tax=Streptomyces thioluteus TaxID=66431 RepID=A0ABN3WH27_STRTU